ncbi:MAG: SMI1/KNR4 family protein [Lachnospiraceae bacterium]
MNKISSLLEIKGDKSVSVDKIEFELVEEYKNFLQNEGGAIGLIGEQENYIELYSCAEVIEANEDYCVTDFLPEHLMIGTVNGEALVLDKESNYYMVPFIGMFKKNCIKIADSLDSLLDYLLNNE